MAAITRCDDRSTDRLMLRVEATLGPTYRAGKTAGRPTLYGRISLTHRAQPLAQEGIMTTNPKLTWATTRHALSVPEITLLFWVLKWLSTALGESSSDYLVHAMPPVVAVLLGFVAFIAALAVQFSRRRYQPWAYWLAVVMVGVFGTMAADVLHVGFGVPYIASTVLYGVALAVVFYIWQRTEHTLSIHSIDTPRREAFYWAAVVATFALGTAAGDLLATTLNFGYFGSALVFAAIILAPVVGYWRLGWNPVFSFWFAYVVTRPLGASVADGLGKPTSAGGLGWGNGTVSLGLSLLVFILVGYLMTKRQGSREHGSAESA